MNNSPPILRTIPSDDDGFREHVVALAARISPQRPYDLGSRLRRLFPRVLVRERQLSGEPLTWYVYRDGAWTHNAEPEWWLAPNVPRMAAAVDGWIVEANTSARGLLGLPDDFGTRHFTDFGPPGTLEDATQLFEVVVRGSAVTATILVKPADGNVIACEAHAERQGDRMVAYLRLTDPVTVTETAVERPSALLCRPETDAAFSSYAQLLLDRMPEPTTEGLALRLHRVYPHASVTTDGETWVAKREGESAAAVDGDRPQDDWWTEQGLPRVRFDVQGLIEEANAAAEAMFGRQLAGHYWQEFVTATSNSQTQTIIQLIAKAGHAESRFRSPDASGRLIEYDTRTTVEGDTLTTVMRPVRPMTE
jgi:PAS domain-containing protein